MRIRKLVLVIAWVCAAATSASAQQADRPIVIDGEDWMKASQRERHVFLVGVANLIVAETAYAKRAGGNVPPVSEGITKGISNLRLAEVEARITRWYEANPGEKKTPVMGVLWHEIARRE